MSMWLMIGAGLILLVLGAESLVRGASALASRLGIPPLVIGLTIVAFGTSAPELVVSTQAALDGFGAIAVGNVVGSNIFNIAVILGISALIRPMKVTSAIVRVDTPVMIVTSALLILLLLDQSVSRLDAGILLAGFIAYLGFTIVLARNNTDPMIVAGTVPKPQGPVILQLALVGAGLAMLVYGSKFFVSGAVTLAKVLQVSDAIIGLTIVAAGTSLPELATSVVAAIRKQDDIAIGNIVGSNIFNILAILGISGLISPLESAGIGTADLVWMVSLAVLLLPLMRTGWHINRWEGGVLVSSYGVYLYQLWPK